MKSGAWVDWETVEGNRDLNPLTFPLVFCSVVAIFGLVPVICIAESARQSASIVIKSSVLTLLSSPIFGILNRTGIV